MISSLRPIRGNTRADSLRRLLEKWRTAATVDEGQDLAELKTNLNANRAGQRPLFLE